MNLISFKFKGSRRYVHGTDMIEKVFQKVDDIDHFNIRIQKMTSNNLILKEEESESPVAKIDIKTHSGITRKFHYDESDENVVGRYEYDEAEVVKKAVLDFDEESIQMNFNDKYSWVENIVALHKRLLNEAISNEVKWLFVGLELKSLEGLKKLSSDNVFTISISKKLRLKLIQSNIYLDNILIGQIKFSSI
ncbi:MAG: hypothetical protein ABJI69_16180 [Balneola sp.]